MKKIHMAFVDDDKSLAYSVQSYIDKKTPHMQCASYTDPRQALEALHNKDNSFDIIVTDFHMPHMDGLSFFLQARKDCKKKTHWILSSSYLTPQLIQQSKIIGICSFVSKPFELSHLVKVIQRVLDTVSLP